MGLRFSALRYGVRPSSVTTDTSAGTTTSSFTLYRPFIEVLLLALVQTVFFFILIVLDALSQQPYALLFEFNLIVIAILGVAIFSLRDENLWFYYAIVAGFGLTIDVLFLVGKLVILIVCDVHPGCSDYTIWFILALVTKFLVTLVQVHAFVISYEAARDWEFFKQFQLRKPLSRETNLGI